MALNENARKWVDALRSDKYALGSPLGRFISPNKLDYSLAGMNDGGATFGEIADMIESEPEGLFADA